MTGSLMPARSGRAIVMDGWRMRAKQSGIQMEAAPFAISVQMPLAYAV